MPYTRLYWTDRHLGPRAVHCLGRITHSMRSHTKRGVLDADLVTIARGIVSQSQPHPTRALVASPGPFVRIGRVGRLHIQWPEEKKMN